MSERAMDGTQDARGPLVAVASGAFLLLVAALAGPIAPMGITTALAGALTLACLVLRQGRAWPRTPVDRAALGWLAALVIVSAVALDRAGSFPRVAKGFMPLLVGLAAWHTADERSGRRALAVYLVAFALVSGWGFVLWAMHGASFASRARGLAGHYMTFAGQLLLFIPVALGIALKTRSPRWRWAAAGVALLAFAPLAATFTRSAWLGLFVACAVLLALTRPLGLAVLAVLAAAAWYLAPGAWGERLHSVADPANLWNRERVFMWDAGVRMFRDHPLTGVGLQDLHSLYDAYRSPESMERAGHLHNAYIQIAASMGLVGLAAFAWLYASLLGAAWAGGGAASERIGLGAGVRLGVTAALVGFLVAGLFEWNFGDEELLYHLYTLVGIAWASRRWTEKRL
jgi:O-antigen ligase